MFLNLVFGILSVVSVGFFQVPPKTDQKEKQVIASPDSSYFDSTGEIIDETRRIDRNRGEYSEEFTKKLSNFFHYGTLDEKVLANTFTIRKFCRPFVIRMISGIFVRDLKGAVEENDFQYSPDEASRKRFRRLVEEMLLSLDNLQFGRDGLYQIAGRLLTREDFSGLASLRARADKLEKEFKPEGKTDEEVVSYWMEFGFIKAMVRQIEERE